MSVSGEPAGTGLRRSRKGNANELAFIDNCQISDKPEIEIVVPDRIVKVRVLPPFSVCHNGIRSCPGDVAEVPTSDAAEWRLHGWVE
ncbi:hypothetical protein [Mycolicibacterium llatzerense]|uniref:hypothetical protein n=1 Tax=Mycolicibacterium llatzerense TaxID=280871 RepID=UPI000A4DB589|nr:hypothetical protein [Mycolicibacterium llatzerense]